MTASCPFTGPTANISNIFNNMLFLGSQYSSRNNELVKYNISHVISIGCDPVYNLPNITNHKFNIEDNGDPNNVFTFFSKIIPEIHDLINNLLDNNIKVLVHCQAGISRSAIVVIMWLIKYKNMDYDCAFAHVKERRPIISPNSSFVDYIKTK